MNHGRYSSIQFMSSLSDLAGRLAAIHLEDRLSNPALQLVVPEVVRIGRLVHLRHRLVDGLVERHGLLDAARAREVPLEALEVVLELFDCLDAVLADADADPAVGIDHAVATARRDYRPIAGLTTGVQAA